MYSQKDILSSVIDNLVFNAIEHAKCKNIVISVVKTAVTCKLTVTDDGVGIESGRDVFLPYFSEKHDSDNLGLGLYICRQHLLMMGADLSYARENDKTVFTITLNLA